MGKHFLRKMSFLTLIILIAQVFLPIASAFASSALPPSNLAIQKVTPSDVRLSWSSVFGATGYNVYEITEGQLILHGRSTSTTYNINNVTEGSYRYVVTTLTSEGESGPTAPVSVDIEYPEMKAPENLRHTIRNGNDIVLNWGASQYAQQYHIFQISAEGESNRLTSVTSSTYTLSNVPEGNYEFVVSASHSLYGKSSFSNNVELEILHPIMEAPGNFNFTVANGSDLTLRWNAVPFATNYRVYQMINGERVLRSMVTGTSVKYSNVPFGDYEYEVRSNSDRFGESVEGSSLTLTVSDVTMSAPQNLTYNLRNINDIALSWSSVPNATGYRVYEVINGEKQLRRELTGTSVTFSNMPAESYSYEVHSYSNRFGESETGSAISLTIDQVTMESPTNLTFNIQNGNDIVLNWGSVANATNYRIYQVVNGEKVLRSTVTGTTVRYNNQPAGNYHYVVTSVSTRFGESPEGIDVSVSLEHPTMEPPTNVIQTITSPTAFNLKWDAAPFATSYIVYQIVNGQKTSRTVTGTSISYSNMAPGEYNYVIHAVSSRFGDSVEGTPIKVTLNGQTMETPTNGTYTITNANNVTLRWGSVQYVTNYRIYQVIDDERVLIRTVTGTNVTLTNLAGGDHKYVVHSFSTLLGESPEGAAMSFSLVLPEMEAPQDLTSQIQNGNNVVLNWKAVSFADNYNVYELVDGEKILRRTVSGVSTTFTNELEGKHTYVVHSNSNRFGESEIGSEVVVTIIFPTMAKPDNVSFSLSNGNDIQLRWDAVTHANNYLIYQVVNGEKKLVSTRSGTSVSFTNMPEGNYQYVVHSTSDRFGESPLGSEILFTLVHPTMQAPENFRVNDISNGNDIVLRWDASAFATGYKVYRVVNGQKVLERTVTGTTTTFTNMPEGDYTFVVYSVSNRFGDSSEGSMLNTTLVWPTVQPPTVARSISNINNITLTWPVATWANEYRVYRISNSGRELVYRGTARTFAINNLTEATHTFAVTSFSTRFGESELSNHIVETIVYPIMEPPAAKLQVLDNNTSARISWDFINYANGYNVYQLVDGVPVLIAERVNNLSYTVNNLPYANHEFYVTSYSNSFGESAPSNTVLAKLIVDTEAPVTAIDVPNGWVNKEVVGTLTATDNETGVAKTYYSLDGEKFIEGTTFTVSTEGIHSVAYYSVDKVGNFEEVKTANVKIDLTAPVTTASVPSTWSNTPVEITLTGTDRLSGVSKTYYSINGSNYNEGTSVAITEDGVHELRYYSIDNAGNVEAVKTAEVKIDLTAPVTTAAVPATWSNTPVEITLVATDVLSGVSKTYYSINGSEFFEGTSFTITEDRVHDLRYFSIDNAGNVEAVKTAEIKIDQKAPVTTATVPVGWNNAPVEITLIGTDVLSGMSKTYYSINGSEFNEGTSLTITADGIHEFSYYSIDNVGNVEAVKTAEVKVDQVAPVTTATVPSTWSNTPVEITLNSADEVSGVSKTYYSINGSDFLEGTSFVISTEGIHEVRYYSVDNAGNVEAIQTAEVKIDQTAPVVKWNIDSEIALGTQLSLQFDVVEELSGIKSETIVVNGKVYNRGDVVTFNEPGTQTLKLTVEDHAGNKTVFEREFVIYIPIEFDVLPMVITPNTGVFNVRVHLPKSFNSKNFILDSVRLNGVKAITKNNGNYKQAELGHFQFNRDEFEWNPNEQLLEFRGMVGDHLVVGYTTVRVQNHNGNGNKK